MYKATYNGRVGEVTAEYNSDGVDYVTMIFEDVEINWIEKENIIVVE